MKRIIVLVMVAGVMAAVSVAYALPALADDASPNCTQILNNVNKAITNDNDHQLVGLLEGNPECVSHLTSGQLTYIVNQGLVSSFSTNVADLISRYYYGYTE